MKDQKQLRQELRAEGASDAELQALLPIATDLRQLRNGRVLAAASRPQRALPRFMQPVTYTVAGVVAGMFLVMVSQAVLPTSWLYPAQQLSDSVAIDLHPEYRATIMMKRAQQVNQLVAAHANSRVVLATLSSYTSIAGAYKSTPHADYSAFEFCESNLEQAAHHASPEVQRAITSSLQSLQAA
jgi:hypothetical protein